MLLETIGLVLLVPVAALAVWQICEIWNHGSIFEEWKDKCEILTELWWARLLSCIFCLSNWVALCCSVLVILTVLYSVWFALPLATFASARLANLGNDLFKDYCLTPTADDGLPLSVPVIEGEPTEAPFVGILKPGFEEGFDFHA